jgi:cysteine desulfurase
MALLVKYLPVDSDGRVDPDSVRARIRPDTALVSVIYATMKSERLIQSPKLGQSAGKQGMVPYRCRPGGCSS